MRQSLPTCSISIFLKPLQLWKNIRAREALKAISSDNYCYANSPTLLPSNSSKRKVASSLTPNLIKKTFWKLLRKYTPWGPVLTPFWESSNCPWQWWRVMIARLRVYTTRSFRSKGFVNISYRLYLGQAADRVIVRLLFPNSNPN